MLLFYGNFADISVQENPDVSTFIRDIGGPTSGMIGPRDGSVPVTPRRIHHQIVTNYYHTGFNKT